MRPKILPLFEIHDFVFAPGIKVWGRASIHLFILNNSSLSSLGRSDPEEEHGKGLRRELQPAVERSCTHLLPQLHARDTDSS